MWIYGTSIITEYMDLQESYILYGEYPWYFVASLSLFSYQLLQLGLPNEVCRKDESHLRRNWQSPGVRPGSGSGAKHEFTQQRCMK